MKLTITDVATRLNKSPQYIRICLQRGLFPFGTALKLPDSSRWNYMIFPAKFEEYIGKIDEPKEKEEPIEVVDMEDSL